MDLRHLKYFLAVVETRNFTRAAAHCYVAQSALSQQIARLEKDVGAELFSRTSRSVRLTAAGELLAPLAPRILADVDHAQEELDALAGLRRGRLRLGLVQTLAGSLDMVEVMADYHARHPGIDYHLVNATSTETAAAVASGGLDLAVVDAVRYPLIVLLGLAMGLQNAVARTLAVPDLTTTVLTLTITGIASDSHIAGGAGSRAGRRVLSAAAMFLGALIGALAVLHGHQSLPLLLTTLLLAAVTAASFTLARSDRIWTQL